MHPQPADDPTRKQSTKRWWGQSWTLIYTQSVRPVVDSRMRRAAAVPKASKLGRSDYVAKMEDRSTI